MQTNNEYLDEWPVRPIGKRELAMAYAPISSPSSALNRLAGWVRHHRKLSHELDETGYQNRQRIFTSLQVELIFRYLAVLERGSSTLLRVRISHRFMRISALAHTYIGVALCGRRREAMAGVRVGRATYASNANNASNAVPVFPHTCVHT